MEREQSAWSRAPDVIRSGVGSFWFWLLEFAAGIVGLYTVGPPGLAFVAIGLVGLAAASPVVALRQQRDEARTALLSLQASIEAPLVIAMDVEIDEVNGRPVVRYRLHNTGRAVASRLSVGLVHTEVDRPARVAVGGFVDIPDVLAPDGWYPRQEADDPVELATYWPSLGTMAVRANDEWKDLVERGALEVEVHYSDLQGKFHGSSVRVGDGRVDVLDHLTASQRWMAEGGFGYVPPGMKDTLDGS